MIVGATSEFDYQTHQPSDNAWKNRKYFYDCRIADTWTKDMAGRGDREAAKYIVEQLSKILEESIKENAEIRDKKKAR